MAQGVASVGLCHSVSIAAEDGKKAFLHMIAGGREHSWTRRTADRGLAHTYLVCRYMCKSCHIYFYSNDRGTGMEEGGGAG